MSPYIPEYKRNSLDSFVSPDTVGELNYAFTSIINCYLSDNGLSYDSINDIVGAIECAKLELYRRIAAPYEDKKKDQNGEVYECLIKR